jgi:DNA modification methylase
MNQRYKILSGDNLEQIKTLADCSIDAIVTDPPYGLGQEPDALQVLTDWTTKGFHEIEGRGFAGKTWDAFVPQPLLWRECFRVLKPGGYLLSFAGARTYDWMVLGLRLGGFEIRDQLLWLYGSGFPKSLNLSMAIDAADAPGKQRARQLQFTAWMRSTGLTARAINDATGTNMGGHYLTDKEQPSIATLEHLDKLRPLLGPIPEWVEEMARQRSAGSDNIKKRRPVDVRVKNQSVMRSIGNDSVAGWYTQTEGHTDQARAWEGWGTTLKPAHEPIVMARKPFKGTVAENVLTNGTGGLNIGACRVPYLDPADLQSATWGRGTNIQGGNFVGAQEGDGRTNIEGNPQGRFPSNVVHDGSPEVLEYFSAYGERGQKLPTAGKETTDHQDSGSAARFFYCAKATKKDRDEGLEFMQLQKQGSPRRNAHPTVKPTALMAWLCRLVTPPGGLILDPFAGSGSTGKAAILEGFNVVLMEREAEYLPLISARLRYAQEVLDKSDKTRKFSALQLALMIDNQEGEDRA